MSIDRVPCPRCKQMIKATAKFCSTCGEQVQPQQSTLCSQCGTPMEAQEQYCPECGALAIGHAESQIHEVAAEAYCVKCKTKRQIKDAVQITMKNGRPATEGKCPECGTKMFKIGAAS